MKKIFTAMLAAALLSGALFAAVPGNTAEFGKEYKAIQETFKEGMKDVKTRDAYQKLMKARREGLEGLLAKIKDIKGNDEIDLLTGNILMDLNQKVPALEKYEALIGKKSTQTIPATFGKVRILLSNRKYKEAYELFKNIDNKVEIDDNYLMAIFELSYEAEDMTKRVQYANKYIAEAAGREDLERYSAMMYENLANISKDKGDIPKGIKILNDGLVKMKTERAKNSIIGALKQIKMLNQPPPEIEAQVWVNSDPLTLKSLKGKVVLIDFWATWCPPCRRVIPHLVENYGKYKDQGLEIIGFTRLYGTYRDNTVNKGKVPAEEEIKLTKEFLKRFKINYPVAIAKGEDVFKEFGVSGIPTLVFIDKKGNVHEVEVGSGGAEKIEDKIKSLLK